MRLITLMACAALLAMALPLSADRQDVAPINKEDPRLQRQHGRWFLEGMAFTGELSENYEDGSIKSLTPFENGNREGQAQGWWPGGELQYQRQYQQDLLHGESEEYYRTGQIRYRQLFAQGHESGLQQGWHEDGEPAFAYAYRDGRRYGVLGSRPCFSVEPGATEVFNEVSD